MRNPKSMSSSYYSSCNMYSNYQCALHSGSNSYTSMCSCSTNCYTPNSYYSNRQSTSILPTITTTSSATPMCNSSPNSSSHHIANSSTKQLQQWLSIKPIHFELRLCLQTRSCLSKLFRRSRLEQCNYLLNCSI